MALQVDEPFLRQEGAVRPGRFVLSPYVGAARKSILQGVDGGQVAFQPVDVVDPLPGEPADLVVVLVCTGGAEGCFGQPDGHDVAGSESPELSRPGAGEEVAEADVDAEFFADLPVSG